MPPAQQKYALVVDGDEIFSVLDTGDIFLRHEKIGNDREVYERFGSLMEEAAELQRTHKAVMAVLATCRERATWAKVRANRSEIWEACAEMIAYAVKEGV